MRLSLACLAALFAISSAHASAFIEPKLTIPPGTHHGPRVALTFDACTGQADERILSTLISNRVPATIFVTARWLAKNPAAIAELKAHPDLFEIENHGAKHLPAIDVPAKVYGIATAGSPEALRAEISGGASAVEKTFGVKPRWYRGATGLYNSSALALIQSMGYRTAGYSVIGDGGAAFSTAVTEKHIAAAKDGDVIIAHVNQPKRPAGAGVVQGILALKARGFRFVKLDDALGAEPPAPVLTH
ncbi:polysaccharide deacetylase family protein [Aestuariivirga sp.]|uniref:polysaccharide deacetylase family protein n=1 Tax=Aestuariivirga sp. TaxID=2650926 RepID=UPI0039E2E482